jgi:hypothetical protein
LQWTPVPNAVSYSVWSSTGGGAFTAVLPSTNNAAAYLPGLNPGDYLFQVRARDASGNDVATSNPLAVSVAAPR